MQDEYISRIKAKDALAVAFSFHSYAGGMACNVIDQIPAEKVSECPNWISVKEKLPDKSGTYLICTNRGNVVSAAFASRFQRFNGYAGRSCTHWMNLPDPPKEGTNEEKTDN